MPNSYNKKKETYDIEKLNEIEDLTDIVEIISNYKDNCSLLANT